MFKSNFSDLQITETLFPCYISTSIFDMLPHSLDAVSPVKYEHDSNYLRDIFTNEGFNTLTAYGAVISM